MNTATTQSPTPYGGIPMHSRQAEALYRIRFPDGTCLTASKAQIAIPLWLKAIDHIEQEPGCTGLTLVNGIEINRVA